MRLTDNGCFHRGESMTSCETRNPSIVQYVHLFSIAREVRVMGSHLIIPLLALTQKTRKCALLKLLNNYPLARC